MTRQTSRLPAMTGDADYVTTFQSLCDLNLAIKEHGPTARLLLRKAYLQMALGDHVGAVDTSEHLCTAAPTLAEAWFVRGEAHMAVAFVTAGFAVSAPHHDIPADADAQNSLQEARDAYEMALEFHDADEQAADRLRCVKILQDCSETDAFQEALGGDGAKRPPRPAPRPRARDARD